MVIWNLEHSDDRFFGGQSAFDDFFASSSCDSFRAWSSTAGSCKEAAGFRRHHQRRLARLEGLNQLSQRASVEHREIDPD